MDWAKYLGKRLVEASWQGVEAVKDVLPAETSVKLLEAASVRLRQEPTVVDVSSHGPPQHRCLGAPHHAALTDLYDAVQIDPKEDGACVRVVGDTHGQLHDVLRM